MRLGSVTVSAALSAVLLSGCSFIGGQPGQYKNPYAKQKAANHAAYVQAGYGQAPGAGHCQVFSPQQPIPRGCRPEQVTLAVAPQRGPAASTNGFPQRPHFGAPAYGQPLMADGAYGSAIGAHATPHAQHATGPKLRKPRLRGALSIGVEKSNAGSILDYGVRNDLDPSFGYNPQTYNEGSTVGTPADGSVTTTTYTANSRETADIFTPNQIDFATTPTISFDDVWSTPASVKAGLEYIAGKNTTVFVNGGYTHAEGNSGQVSSANATLYQEISRQPFAQDVDGAGDPIPGSFSADGAPEVQTFFIPNQEIARFSYDFSDLKQYELEVGARHYFKPIIKSEGYKTVTPFVGASVGASHVSALDISQTQEQLFYQRGFEGSSDDLFYEVGAPGSNRTRVYDAQWLPQGQLNVGAEWQVTPGFALAAESGVRIQGAREYADFTNAAGDTVSGAKGDANVSIPLTLRGSVNF